MREDLIHLGLSEEKAELVCSQWKTNLLALSRIAAGQSLTVNQLVDMEWRFGGKRISSPLFSEIVILMYVVTYTQ